MEQLFAGVLICSVAVFSIVLLGKLLDRTHNHKVVVTAFGLMALSVIGYMTGGGFILLGGLSVESTGALVLMWVLLAVFIALCLKVVMWLVDQNSPGDIDWF